ncbi:hypothetical protein DJ568_13185 [Mucilaginibacter hurinus]|uniref:Uncharacterized protein n=1 Tax=Mucilaginibacter hurinus TaxID=2201324 RepID=A0A367GL94_9SPHI|nr:hypothetical protein [Mucilaginibacter hurinus]RCH54247.1 hypothetical protein DJ568_13185 [Mucilaginibacter hurinus]
MSVSKLVKQVLLLKLLLLCAITVFAQNKPSNTGKVKAKIVSAQLSHFRYLSNQANVIFAPQAGFREIKALNNEDFTFDYAMDLPGREFEVWYVVRSQKENWASYERVIGDEKLKLENPDSIYMDMGRAHAIALTGERNFFIRTLPASVLNRYNADAGRSYLLNLLDMPETKRYRYALLLSLQKFRTGTIMMVCFTNSKTPEFYKNVERAGSCVKFRHNVQNVSKLTD